MSTARITIWTVVLFAWAEIAAAQALPPGVEKPADASEVFVIWPGHPPGTTVTGQPEQVTQAMGGPAGRWVRNVEVPTLTAFLPDPAKATGTAVVVAPGGANLFLSIDHEGYEVARWFAERGVAAFVLRYRVRPTPRDPAAFADRLRQVMGASSSAEDPDDGSMRWPHAADDGRQAIRIIRERAHEWNVDPRRIGIVGFSAGGFVVNDVAVEYDESSRPDFAASIYAGLLGPVTVPEDAPPLFIAYAVDDPLMSERVLPLFTAWRDAGKPVELHAYETGGHGFGMSAQNTTSDRWIDALGAWLAHHGLTSEARDGGHDSSELAEVIIPHRAPALPLFAACVASPIATAGQTLGITDVTVVDVAEGTIAPGMTMVVTGDRITVAGGGLRPSRGPGTRLPVGPPDDGRPHRAGVRMLAGSDAGDPGIVWG